MANTTYFTFNELSPLTIPDDGSHSVLGYVSSNKVPTPPPGTGTATTSQVLDGTNCFELSEYTTNTGGREIRVSWMMRDTGNQYGVTRLPPKL